MSKTPWLAMRSMLGVCPPIKPRIGTHVEHADIVGHDRQNVGETCDRLSRSRLLSLRHPDRRDCDQRRGGGKYDGPNENSAAAGLSPWIVSIPVHASLLWKTMRYETGELFSADALKSSWIQVQPHLDETTADVRFGSKADMCSAQAHVRFTPNSDIDCVFRHVIKDHPPRYRQRELLSCQRAHVLQLF